MAGRASFVAVVPLLAVVGVSCGPSEYKYSLVVPGTGLELHDAELAVDGKPLRRDEVGFVWIPRGVLLSDPDTKLTATLETTCGKVAVPMRSADGDGWEEKERGAGRTVSSILEPVDADVRPVTVYLDNSTEGQPATFRFGKTVFTVPATGVMHHDLVVGPCEEGKRVRVNDLPPTPLPRTGRDGAALISTSGDTCYLQSELLATEGGARDVDGRLKPPTVYRIKGHVQAVPKVAFPLIDPADLEGKSTAATNQVFTVLTPLSCVVAAAYQKSLSKPRAK